ncbi:hypothetical protein [Mucilaginibacter ginkgonis]|uniref:Uncharacterized protein n=1 Tax=Mucilaginibacter ginkgonis TaxID=2682091 RepID=A0A6I4I5X4_9SPHI|nr:hypothetical protein [Mucilaginibacter ginkgonis]QQL50502.1 hypothetical protein GO620_003340 [Mucilaginibacter ginkgonis]
MKLRDFKIGLCILFLGIFMTKMVIGIAPIFVSMNNKTVNAVITQLEQETKGDKDSAEKDFSKEKKFFDEKFIHHHDYTLIVSATIILHNKEKALFKQVYHPRVPVPPPNV